MIEALNVFRVIWFDHVRRCYRYHRLDCGQLRSARLAVGDATHDAWTGMQMNRWAQEAWRKDQEA